MGATSCPPPLPFLSFSLVLFPHFVVSLFLGVHDDALPPVPAVLTLRLFLSSSLFSASFSLGLHLRMAFQTTLVAARSGGTNAPPSNTSDFLNHFAAQEQERRISKRPEPLSVEEHAEHCKQLQSIRFVRPSLSDLTWINIGVVQGKWMR